MSTGIFWWKPAGTGGSVSRVIIVFNSRNTVSKKLGLDIFGKAWKMIAVAGAVDRTDDPLGEPRGKPPRLDQRVLCIELSLCINAMVRAISSAATGYRRCLGHEQATI